ILNRDSHSRLGIKIVGGCDFGIPVIIIGLRPNSPAQISGEIFIGDQILSVNDVPINENSTHNDALRLLAECGSKVSLLLKHTKSVMNFGRKWKHENFSMMDKVLNNNNNERNGDYLNPETINTTSHRHMSFTLNPKDFNREKSISPDHNTDNDNSNYRINLFLTGTSRYVSFSDRLRDAGFEILRTTNSDRSIVIECLTEDICLKWFTTIRNTIENLTNNFVRILLSCVYIKNNDFFSFQIQNFNKHLSKNEHFLYMGYVSERIIVESPPISLFSSKSSIFSHLLSHKSSNNHHHNYRWLSRFLIIKGGKIYLFKVAPTETLLNYKRKIENISFQRKHRANSNGSSLGSVGSSSTSTTSDTSNFSNTNGTNQLNGFYVNGNGYTDNSSTLSSVGGKAINSKPPSRLNKLNKCLENELDLLAIEHWHCYQSDFRCLKPTEQMDNKRDCFVISNSQSQPKYFSTECSIQLERLNDAWNMANYFSVLKNECKIYTVAFEPGNIIGSFKIDWKSGFSFYDPKHNECLWSYQFYQLKHSSDDGKEILSLSFMLESSDDKNRLITRHVLRCTRQHQVIIRNIHSKTIQQSFCPLLPRSLNQSSKPVSAIRFNAQRFLSSDAHSHTKIWVIEKAVSAGLLAVIPAALMYPNQILDYCLALSLVMHCHWGFEAIVVDYIRPSLVGSVIPKISLISLYLVSMMALAGLFYLNYSDVGTATAIKMFAKIYATSME
ncbi:PDZ domain containing protein, partial [Euroglyphus maynei]